MKEKNNNNNKILKEKEIWQKSGLPNIMDINLIKWGTHN